MSRTSPNAKGVVDCKHVTLVHDTYSLTVLTLGSPTSSIRMTRMEKMLWLNRDKQYIKPPPTLEINSSQKTACKFKYHNN